MGKMTVSNRCGDKKRPPVQWRDKKRLVIISDLVQDYYTGWWYTYPSEKYESQLGWLFPIYGKIKFMFQTTNQLWRHWLRIPWSKEGTLGSRAGIGIFPTLRSSWSFFVPKIHWFPTDFLLYLMMYHPPFSNQYPFATWINIPRLINSRTFGIHKSG